MPKKALRTIAFDLGGVIFSQKSDIFSESYLETELTPGIYEVVLQLAKLDHVKLIVLSKAFPKNARKSKEILKLYGLEDHFNSIVFCEDNQSKAEIAKAMRVDVMIDDKEEVLQSFDASIQTVLFDASDVYRLLDRILV